MSVAEAAKAVYNTVYRVDMEKNHFGEFIAIEPESKAHFVAASFMEAALAAKESHPTKMSFVIKIGHDAAVHIGSASV